VFFISAAVYAFGTIFYAIFGSGELQPLREVDSKISTVEGQKKKKSADIVEDNIVNPVVFLQTDSSAKEVDGDDSTV